MCPQRLVGRSLTTFDGKEALQVLKREGRELVVPILEEAHSPRRAGGLVLQWECLSWGCEEGVLRVQLVVWGLLKASLAVVNGACSRVGEWRTGGCHP